MLPFATLFSICCLSCYSISYYILTWCALFQLMVVKQEDKLELIFKHFLVEDKNNSGGASYVDFLCHMHKEIRQLLS